MGNNEKQGLVHCIRTPLLNNEIRSVTSAIIRFTSYFTGRVFITPCLSKEAKGERIYYHHPRFYYILALPPLPRTNEYNYWVYGS